METYISSDGNPEIHDEKPEGYFTVGEWNELHPPQEPEWSPGPDHEKCGEDWWKVRFSKKDFLLLCGIPQIAALNTVRRDNAMAETVYTLLMAADFIDVTDPATVQLVGLLATGSAGNVLTAADVARILQGVKHVEDVEAQA